MSGLCSGSPGTTAGLPESPPLSMDARGEAESAAVVALGVAGEAIRVEQRPHLRLEEIEVGGGEIRGGGTAGEGQAARTAPEAEGSFHGGSPGVRNDHPNQGGRQGRRQEDDQPGRPRRRQVITYQTPRPAEPKYSRKPESADRAEDGRDGPRPMAAPFVRGRRAEITPSCRKVPAASNGSGPAAPDAPLLAGLDWDCTRFTRLRLLGPCFITGHAPPRTLTSPSRRS